MKLSRIGRVSMALVVSVAMGLGMTACGGGTIGFMWVLGTQFNQIAAFKIDDFTGNLTSPPGSPFTSAGTNPVSLVVRTGGRYLYVINQGSALPADSNGVVTCQVTGGDGHVATVGEFSLVSGHGSWGSPNGADSSWLSGARLVTGNETVVATAAFTGT